VIHNGRFTAAYDGGFVVFIIGMRINKMFAVRSWLPIFTAMRPMLQRLNEDPALGFLHGTYTLIPRGAALIQYWRSFEDLERFAKNPVEPHLAAWKRFNRRVGNDGSVGVFHETFEVAPGRWESVYVNMPVFGLAAATSHVAVKAATEAAGLRFGR
jgi:hypothetical protein